MLFSSQQRLLTWSFKKFNCSTRLLLVRICLLLSYDEVQTKTSDYTHVDKTIQNLMTYVQEKKQGCLCTRPRGLVYSLCYVYDQLKKESYVYVHVHVDKTIQNLMTMSNSKSKVMFMYTST